MMSTSKMQLRFLYVCRSGILNANSHIFDSTTLRKRMIYKMSLALEQNSSAHTLTRSVPNPGCRSYIHLKNTIIYKFYFDLK